MLSHAWVLACAESLYEEDELHVITVRVGGILAGAAPLVTRNRLGAKHLELMGASQLYEPSGLLYDSDTSLDALLQAIVSVGRPIVLSRIPSPSPIAARLRAITRGRGVMAAKPVSDTLAVPITSQWSEYLAELSSRQRYDLGRARRRAEASGSVAARIHSPRPEEVAGMFAELVRIEAAGWKGRRGSSLNQRDSLRRFFLNYAMRASQSGSVRFGFLDIDGRPAAAQLSVAHADRLWVLKIGYDEAWSRCSPGTQLLSEAMRDAFERKLKSFEFLGSDEPWLHQWKTDRRAWCTLAYYPPTVPGLCGLAVDTLDRVRARVASWPPRRHRRQRPSGAQEPR